MSGKALGGKKVSREKIEALLSLLKEKGLESHIEKFEVCGSYRRGKKDSGDIDIVVIPKDTFVPWIESLGYENKPGAFGYYLLIEEVQIDFFITNIVGWPTSVMMWTGTRGFNILIRGKSIKAGYIYTRHGMFKEDTKELVPEIKTEFDIFNLIGLKYIPPEKR